MAATPNRGDVELNHPEEYVKYLKLYRELLAAGWKTEAVVAGVGYRMGKDPSIPDDMYSMWGIPILRGEAAEEALHNEIC